jgi:N,N'-diacetyllegionaminate synthase
VKIAKTNVAPGSVYVIAELGVNHDGSPARAMELASAAADAGADAIKLQFFTTDLLMSRAAILAAYQRAAGERDPIGMLRRLELPLDAMAKVVALAHSRGVHAIVTVFSTELVPLAERLAWDAYKTASPDLIHRPLLEALAATGRPLIVSTGAAEMEEVQRAVRWLEPARERLAVLQCVSAYPSPDTALDGMVDLAAHLPGLAIGYSDHTPGLDTGARAVELGACVLEKHLTYDRAAAGPDHAASLDPAGFAEYVRLAKAARPRPPAQRDQPPGAKRVLDSERDVRVVSRQSLVARRPLPAGTSLSREDLTVKRPGTGIPPFELENVIGRRLTTGVEADGVISWAMVERPPVGVATGAAGGRR